MREVKLQHWMVEEIWEQNLGAAELRRNTKSWGPKIPEKTPEFRKDGYQLLGPRLAAKVDSGMYVDTFPLKNEDDIGKSPCFYKKIYTSSNGCLFHCHGGFRRCMYVLGVVDKLFRC